MDPLLQLLIIWLGVFVAAFAAQKTRLTSVLYFLAIGALLVNLDVLPEKSDPFIRGFAEIGIIVIMFALGFEESTSNFLKSIKRSWGIALFGGIAPFVTAYGVAEYFWSDTGISIMCGLAMTSTAVSLTMVSLKSEGLHRSPAATGIMTSAVLEDISSLVLVAILVPITTGGGSVSAADVAWIVFKAIGFFGIVTLIGSWLLPHKLEGLAARIPFIRKYGIRHLLHIAEGEHSTLIVLTLALSVGLIAHGLGFHPAVGAFMAGLVLKEEYFHLKGRVRGKYYEQTKAIVDNVAFSWIGPVFFVNLGTKLIFDWDIFVSVIPHTFVLTTGMILAQVSSSGLAARYTGNFTSGESLMIGFGMLGRAELAFVVLDIAYVQHQILSTPAFYTLMFTAFWLNVAVPVTIAWWKPYYTGEKKFLGLSGPATEK